MVCLHIFPVFSFLAKMLSFLLRDDNILTRNEDIEKYACGLQLFLELAHCLLLGYHKLYAIIKLLITPKVKSYCQKTACFKQVSQRTQPMLLVQAATFCLQAVMAASYQGALSSGYKLGRSFFGCSMENFCLFFFHLICIPIK